MGVHGLWSLLKESGRPLDTKQLEGKVMAVDISIWLNMAVKGARDYHGNNALSMHLISLFHRICKLLHMGVKPVFVFDGKPPALKQKTLQERKQTRSENKKESNSANKKILLNKLKKQALECVANEDPGTSKPKKNKNLNVVEESSANLKEKIEDIYHLPPLSSALQDEFEEIQNNAEGYIGYSDINELAAIKYEDKEFKSLPDEMQYELLRDIKEVKKRRHTKIETMPLQSESFSIYQITGLLDKNKLSKRMTDMEKRMSKKQAHDVDSSALMELYEGQAESNRVEKVFGHNTDRESILIHQKQQKMIVKKENNGSLETEVIEEPQFLKRKHKSVSAKAVTLKMKNKIKTSSVNANISLSDSGSSSEDEEVDSKRKKSNKNVKEISKDVIEVDEQATNMDITESTSKSQKKKEFKDDFKINYTVSSKTLVQQENIGTISHENDDKVTPLIQNKTVTFANDNVETKPSTAPTIVKNFADIKNQEVIESFIRKTDEAESDDEFIEVEPKKEEKEVTAIKHNSADDNNVPVESKIENPWKNVDLTNVDILKENLQNESKNLQEVAEAKNRAAREVSNTAHAECKELLTLFGIPYIMSPGEAEAQCACLETLGLSFGSITDDSDIWLFGGKLVVKDMFSGKRTATQFSINDIEDHLNLNRDKMISIALCSGSDYTNGISGIGPKTSLEIINEFKCDKPENLQKFKDWCMGNENELEITSRKLLKFKNVKLKWNFPSEDVINAYLNPETDKSDEKFTWGIPDLGGLRDFAVQRMGWSRQKLNETLLPVIKKMTNQNTKKSISKISRPPKKSNKKNAVIQKNNIEKFLCKSQVVNNQEGPVLSEVSSDSE